MKPFPKIFCKSSLTLKNMEMEFHQIFNGLGKNKNKETFEDQPQIKGEEGFISGTLVLQKSAKSYARFYAKSDYIDLSSYLSVNEVDYLKLSSKLTPNKGNWRGGEAKIGNFSQIRKRLCNFLGKFSQKSSKIIHFCPTLYINE